MEWQWALLLIMGSLALVLATGIHVAFGFMLVNIMGVLVFYGGQAGFRPLIMSMSESVGTFVLLPVPLFILMGEILFRSGMGMHAIDALEAWMGKLPGRLALLAVAASTLFATMTGSASSSVAALGECWCPRWRSVVTTRQ